MSAEVASAYVSLVPSFRGGTSGIVTALGDAPAQAGEQGGRSFGDRFLSGVGGVVGGIAKVAAVGGGLIAGAGGTALGALLKVGIGYNNLEQSSRAAFTTLLGTSGAADTMMSQLRDFGRTSPFPRQAFIEGTQQLLGFGVSAQQIIPTLSAIQDSVAATGGGADQIGQITYALAQVKGQGKLTGETLNQLGQYGINAAEILAKQFGTTSEDIREMASKPGGIPANKVFDPLVAGLTEKFGGAAANVKNTFAGATDRIKGSFRDLGSSIAEPFVSKQGGGLAVDLMNRVATGIRGLIPLADVIAAKLTALFARPEVGAFLDRMSAGLETLTARAIAFVNNGGIERWIAAVRDGGQKVIDTFGRIKDALSGDPGSQLTTTATNVETGLNSAATSVSGFVASLGALKTGLGDAATGGGVVLSNLLGILGGTLSFFSDHTTLATGAILALTASMAAAGPINQAYQVSQILKTPILVVNTVQTWFQTAATKALTTALNQLTGAENVNKAGMLKSIAIKTGLAVKNGVVAASTWAWSAAQTFANSVQNRGLLGTIRYTAALVAQKVTQFAIATATKAWAAAQWLLNAAMSANPIGLVIAAIVAVVAAIVVAYNKSETFRSIVQAAFQGVATVATWLWENVLKPVFGFVWGVLQQVGAVAVWLWQNVFQPAFAGIAIAVGIAWSIIKVYFNIWLTIIGLVVAAALFLWHNAIEPAFNAIAAVVLWAWTNVIQPTFVLLRAGFEFVAAGATWLYENVIVPVWSAISSAVSSAVGFVVGIVQTQIAILQAIWSATWTVVSGVISNTWSFITGAVSGGFNAVVSLITSIGGAVSSAFHAVFDPIRDFVGGIFSGVAGAFKGALNGIISALNSGIGFINTKLIDTANSSLGFLGVDIPHIPTIPSLATGGVVSATPGGSIVRVAEAGEPEIVSPLSTLRGVVDEALASRGFGAPLVGHLTVQAAEDPRVTAHVVTARLAKFRR